MAAVTVDRIRRNVLGNRRVITAQIDVATTGDTWATGLRRIESIHVSDIKVTSIAVSGGTATLTISGAVTDALATVIGY